MTPEVPGREGLEDRPIKGLEVPAFHEVVGQGACLVRGPGLEGADEAVLVDQPVLEREQSKQKVTRRVVGRLHAQFTGPRKADQGRPYP